MGGTEGTSYFTSDVGPPVARRRTTASYRRIDGQTPVLTAAQLDIFEAWWRDYLLGGVADFIALHPITGRLATFRPAGPYDVTPLGAGKSRVSLTLYEVPA